MNGKPAVIYEFGEFHLDTAEQVLRRDGVVVPLTPKAISVLELLLRRNGNVLSRSEMIETLWPDTFVEEANLTVTISMLRKALDYNGQSYIRTIPKRGYTFSVPVRKILPPKPDRNDPEPFNTRPNDVLETHPLQPEFTRRRPSTLWVIALVPVITLGAWLIYTKSRKRGSEARPAQLTRLTDTGNIRDATISPDGNLLGFVTIEGGREILRLKNLQTNEQTQLREPQEGFCWGLRFTHDGRALYYITTQPNSTISVLYRIGVSGGEPRKIVVNLDSPIALSPDGSQIAFIRSFPGKHYDALVVANNDGTGERELRALSHPQKFSFSGCEWSPDGKTIAAGASRDNGVTFTINTVSLAAGEQRELTSQSWKVIAGLAWTDDGRRLYFNAGTKQAPSTQLWRIDIVSGALEQVTHDTNHYEGVHLTKDGARVLTMQKLEMTNLWMVDSGTVVPRKLTFGIREGEGGVLSLPSDRVLYTIEQNQILNLWVINRDGSHATQVTTQGALQPCATADGKYVVYASARSGVRHLYRLDLASRAEIQLTSGGGEMYPSCSPDGRWVVYTALAGARNTLWRVSIDGDKPVQITRDSIIIKPVISADGKWIACTYRKDEADKWKIAVLPFEGGEPVKVFAMETAYQQIVRWTPDSKNLYYLRHKNGIGNIWKQPLNDVLPAEQVTSFSEDEILNYTQMGNTDSFVVARGRTFRDLILIRNP